MKVYFVYDNKFMCSYENGIVKFDGSTDIIDNNILITDKNFIIELIIKLNDSHIMNGNLKLINWNNENGLYLFFGGGIYAIGIASIEYETTIFHPDSILKGIIL